MENATEITNQENNVGIITVLSLICVFGFLGNLSVCVVIYLNKTLHTTTNCYLFSLAVSDILIIVGDLFTWILHYARLDEKYLGRTSCVLHLLASTFGTYVTLLTITAVSVARYIDICHPFALYRLYDIKKTIQMIIVIWMVGCLVALPQMFKFLDQCNVSDITIYIPEFYKYITSLIYFILYMVIVAFIAVLYWLIYRDLNRPCNAVQPINVVQEENRRVTKILVTIVITLFICWTPLHICHLCLLYLTMDETMSNRKLINDMFRDVETAAGFLFFLISTTINPVIYNILSSKFREAFKETFRIKKVIQISTPKNRTNEEIRMDSNII